MHTPAQKPTADLMFADPATGQMRFAAWQDKAGVIHRAAGAFVHPGIRLLWTLCEKHDIPANGAWLMEPGDEITCPECIAKATQP